MLARLLVTALLLLSCDRKVSDDLSATNVAPVLRTGVNPFSSVSYVNNFDGDTITVNLPNSIPDVFSHEISVRIRHIDTPEIKGKGKCEKEMAQKAKDVVTSLLKNAKKIDLEDVGRDKYFRLLCSVNITTKEDKIIILSQYLLEHGYAVPYEGDTKQVVDWCVMKRKIK
jgi:endonuclease YncB( thermonuclease family)